MVANVDPFDGDEAASCKHWRAGGEARAPAGEDVDRGDLVPVDLRDVPEVRDARVVVLHDPGRGLRRTRVLLGRRLVLAVPSKYAADDGLNTVLEPAVSGEQRAEAQRSLNHGFSYRCMGRVSPR